jgi:photosystem II stability/assembly factor-like uncharacterized protein/phosphoribosyl-AMP cyclohydrolase
VLACTLLPHGVAVAGTPDGQWVTLGPDGGSVTALATHPGDPAVIYAGTKAAGVFKTTDGGATWAAVNTGLTNRDIRALGVHPAAPHTVYAGTDCSGSEANRGIYKSIDGGETWSLSDGTACGVYGFAFPPSVPDTLYAAANGTIRKTVNGGATWEPASNGLIGFPYSLVISPDHPNVLYAGVFGGVFKTEEGGANWTGAMTGLPYDAVVALALDPTAPGTLYAGTAATGLYKTTNGGMSWVPASDGLPGTQISALAIDPSDAATLYAGTAVGVFKSTSGDPWTAVNEDAWALAFALHPAAPGTVYAGTATQGVLKSVDAGESWSVANAGLRAVEVRALAFDPTSPDTIYAGGYTLAGVSAIPSGYGVFKSTDGGVSWQPMNSGLTSLAVSALAVHPFDADTVYVGTLEGVFKTIDGGATWSLSTAGYVACLAVHPAFPQVVYAGIAGGSLLMTTANGGSWFRAGTDPNFVHDVTALALHPTDPNIAYAGTWGGGVWKSTNLGQIWTQVNSGLGNLSIRSLALDPTYPDSLYAGTGGSGIFKTTNGGTNWGSLSFSGSYPFAVAVNPASPTTVYAGTEAGGLFRSTDSGGSWSQLGTGLLPLRVEALAFSRTSATALYAGTGGGVAALLQTRALPTPLAPAGSIIPASPTFVWSAVPGAMAYRLRVQGSISGWGVPPALAGCANGEAICHITWPVALTAGPAEWWVQALYADGEGPWSDGLAFTVLVPTPGAPTGTIADATPTYTWTALPGVAYYHLSVSDSAEAGKISAWYSAIEAGCGTGTGTCRLTPTTALAPGDAAWAVQAWNSGGYGLWSAPQAFHLLGPPGVPTGLGQFQTDGTTAIPPGGTTTQTAVLFKGTGTDVDRDHVRLIVEVKRVGTAFTGGLSCYSPWVRSGIPAQCTVTLAPGAYHWRARMLDERQATGLWASYGGTDETAVDVRVATIPAAPTGLGQFQTTGTVIPAGGTATQPAVVFKATGTDLDRDKVRLLVEVKPVGRPFNGASSCWSTWVNSGTQAQCTATLAPGAYHWQARMLDPRGYTSPWVSYGGTDEAAVDVRVFTPPSAPTGLAQRQTTGTVIPPGGTTLQTTVVFRGVGTDVDGDRVRLIVEVKRVGTAFTGAQSCYSAWVPSGTPTQCTATLAPGAYHWRARMLDARKYTSLWASYGGTDEAAVDFEVVTVPAAPTGLGQFRIDGTTVIPAGGMTTDMAVIFRGAGTDADGDHVRLIVEVKPVGTPFNTAQSCFSGWVRSGAPAQCTVTLPPVTNAYHWRAKILDERDNTSAWVSYGGTDEAVADFINQYEVPRQ